MEKGLKIYIGDRVFDDMFETYHKARIERIYSNQSFQIGRYSLKKDTPLMISPLEKDEIAKSYVVLDGKCIDLKSRKILTSGDIIIVDNEEEYGAFHMLEDTVILVHYQSPETVNTFQRSADGMIQMLSELQAKDQYTKEHSERVYHMALKVGLARGYHSIRMYNFTKAIIFHDIGKCFVRNEILNKANSLNSVEYAEIKEHVHLGKEMIEGTFSSDIYDIVQQHHERMDGSGYPRGLSGDQILEEARILAICDSFDAMTTDRIYKKGKSSQQACDELRDLSGTQYDSALVELFIRLIIHNESPWDITSP